MCVLVVARTTFPTLEQLKLMEKKNPDGGGMAWIEGGAVRWKKGLTAEQIFAQGSRLPLPVVIHFRMATVGGAKRRLTHPFPITALSIPALEGVGDEVLFHNGHWADWKDMWDRAIAAHRLPAHFKGPMSDTRMMALLVGAYGEGIAEMLGLGWQKLVILSPAGPKTYGKFEDWKGLEVSNTHFDVCAYIPPRTYYGYPERGSWGTDSWDDHEYGSHYTPGGGQLNLYKPKMQKDKPLGWCKQCEGEYRMDLFKGHIMCPTCKIELAPLSEKTVKKVPKTKSVLDIDWEKAQMEGGNVIVCSDGMKMVWDNDLGEYIEVIEEELPTDLPVAKSGA